MNFKIHIYITRLLPLGIISVITNFFILKRPSRSQPGSGSPGSIGHRYHCLLLHRWVNPTPSYPAAASSAADSAAAAVPFVVAYQASHSCPYSFPASSASAAYVVVVEHRQHLVVVEA